VEPATMIKFGMTGLYGFVQMTKPPKPNCGIHSNFGYHWMPSTLKTCTFPPKSSAAEACPNSWAKKIPTPQIVATMLWTIHCFDCRVLAAKRATTRRVISVLLEAECDALGAVSSKLQAQPPLCRIVCAR